MTQPSVKEDDNRAGFLFFKGAGGLPIRFGYWASPRRPSAGTVLLLSGRGEFMEKYQETIGELQDRCYDVFSMDWRGQGLSGRETPHRHKGYVADYRHYLDDLDILIEREIRPRGANRLIALAHSMGGHVVLRYLKERPAVFERAVLTSPLVDIHLEGLSARLVRPLTRLAVAMGLARRYTVGSGDYEASARRFAGNRLTSDPERFMIEPRAVSNNPDLALGGVTYGWLAATLESIDQVQDPAFAAGIATPLMIITAGDDRVVSNRAQSAICARIPGCVRKTIPGARHEILFESDPIRGEFWRYFERFVGAPKGTAR